MNVLHTIPNACDRVIDFLHYLRDPEEFDWSLDSFLYDVGNAVEDTKVNPTVRRELMSLSEKLCTEREEGRQEGRKDMKRP